MSSAIVCRVTYFVNPCFPPKVHGLTEKVPGSVKPARDMLATYNAFVIIGASMLDFAFGFAVGVSQGARLR